MSWGPGKYDDLCTLVREKAGITHDSGGTVLLMVIGGNKGNGFSCQGDFLTTMSLPDLLEHVAKDIREHGIAGSS